MMTSLGQAYSPHPGGMHPGVPQGHPMAVAHNPGQQGQPGMPQQMHMGVSGPGGPQVSQAGALMGGMPPGAGGPSQHALQHLNPNAAAQQQQMMQQQQMAFANNPNFQLQQQQQHMIAQQQAQRQRQQQQMMAQHYSGGMPVGVPNGMNAMTQAQFQAMRGAGPTMARPVNLPQHLQQQQAGLQAQHTLEQQQAQAQAQAAQHQQQQQQMMAQQMAMQHQAQAQAQAGNQGQQNQMSAQQMQNMQQQAQLVQQQHVQQQQSAGAAQQNQQAQSQQQPQAQQPNAQAQPQQAQQAQTQPNIQQQQATATAMLAHRQQQQQGDRLRGQCLMKLMQFANDLGNFAMSSKSLETYIAAGAQRAAAQENKQQDDLSYWHSFVNKFFSPRGVMRHSLWMTDESSNKQYEIPYSALPRYFHTHFESGIERMQLITEKGTEKDLPNNGHYIESPKSTFIYWFDNGSQLVANGTLRAHFDLEHKIELLEFVTNNHEEYLPRAKAIEAARPIHEWNKEWLKLNTTQSPELNKKKSKPTKSPANPPPEIEIPPSKVKPNIGITFSVFRFFELAEVMGQMNPLFGYSHQNSSMAPKRVLEEYVNNIVNTTNNPGQQQNSSGPRTPGMPGFGASPAAAHLQLPDGSPHIAGSPAPMQKQQSQHGTSSSGPSANTSPNASNKRRRPSAVKTEEESQVNGTQVKPGVKPSPRIPKRQKPNGP